MQPPLRTQNSNPQVMMMQSAQDRQRPAPPTSAVRHAGSGFRQTQTIKIVAFSCYQVGGNFGTQIVDVEIPNGLFRGAKGEIKKCCRQAGSSASLVVSNQRCLSQDVLIHRLFQPGLGRSVKIARHLIHGIELEEVAMPSDWRTRTAVTSALPVIEPLQRAGRQFGRALGLGETSIGGRRL